MYDVTHEAGDHLMGNEQEDWLSEAQRTGEIFPGRPIIRTGLDFGPSSRKENARINRKCYNKSNSHSRGIFTVQCVCLHSKLLGVSVMMEMEVVSKALSVLLSRFAPLPRVCYYDNACNMAKSIVLHVPWVNDKCLVVCDRFHYKGHTRNSICDPSSYTSCNEHGTSAAESINYFWNFSKTHLRHMNPDNVMPFLAARAVMLNVRAFTRKSTGKSDINPKMFQEYVANSFACICSRFGSHQVHDQE